MRDHIRAGLVEVAAAAVKVRLIIEVQLRMAYNALSNRNKFNLRSYSSKRL